MALYQPNLPIRVQTPYGIGDIMLIWEYSPDNILLYIVVIREGEKANSWFTLRQTEIKSYKHPEVKDIMITEGKTDILYAVGVSDGHGGYAMLAGPNPSMDDMLDSLEKGQYLLRLVDGQITPIGYQQSDKFVSC